VEEGRVKEGRTKMKELDGKSYRAKRGRRMEEKRGKKADYGRRCRHMIGLILYIGYYLLMRCEPISETRDN